MSKSDINAEKANAFAKIQDVLFSLPIENEWDKADHILDVLEQLISHIIASSSLKQDHVDELCAQTMTNIQTLSQQYLEEEFEAKQTV